jgi:glycosyltransferase involved in cell wall biosynthesis
MLGSDNKARPGSATSLTTAGAAASPHVPRRPVVSLVSNDPGVPSFRLRMTALRPILEASGMDVRVLSFGRGREWLRVARLVAGWRSSDLLVFQQVKLLAGERAFVRRLCGSWVLDVDDAIMFRRPRSPGDRSSQAAWRQRRFRCMAARCRLVVSGSQSLAEMISDAAPRLVVLPTPVNLASYPVAPLPGRNRARLAWIGWGSNLRYLEALTPVFQRLGAEGVEYEIHVISDRLPVMPGVPCRLVRWSEAAEGPALADCDVGLAPLADDVWTRGKSGYRCIQYAAAGLPAVASPVGANREVVQDGGTGVWAAGPEEWHAALLRLCGDVTLRRRMGEAARSRAADYDLARFGARYASYLRELLADQIPPSGRNAMS